MSQNSQDKFFGIIISVELLENTELSVAEKFVYSYISSYKNCCADSNSKIGDRLGFSHRTVIRCLNHLEELGYIKTKYSNANGVGRKIYDIYNKPNKKVVLSKTRKNREEIRANNRGKDVEFSTSFPQFGENTIWCDKMSPWCDKMSLQKTEVGVTKCHPKNNKNKKKKENAEQKPNKCDYEKTPSGLAGERPASRLMRRSKVMKLAELMLVGAN